MPLNEQSDCESISGKKMIINSKTLYTESSALDLAALMKASQTITDEIVLNRLIDKILYVMVENARAQQGLFIIKQKDKWHITAEVGFDRKQLNLNSSLPIDDPTANSPVSLINYIIKSGESVVLCDAANEGQFMQDPYIKKNKPVSILGMPLMYKGQISCILYIENNLSRGAFTSEQLKILNLLSTQAAISIENARLYNRLQESEEKYRNIFEDSKDMIFITNTDGKIIDINHACEAQMGYERHELLGLNAQDFYADPEMHAIFKEEMFKHGSVQSFESKMRRKDGNKIDVLISATTRKSENGTILGYQGIVRNVTTQKQAERERLASFELQKTKNAAEEANKAKLTFLSNMSHELRSPLNSIIGFTQLLRQSPNLTKEQKEDLSIINRSGDHLLALINDILDFSNIEAGKQTLNLSFCDLYRILKDIELMIKVRTDSKNLWFRVEKKEPIPRYILTDEAKLRQILINLLVNAVKFTNEGGVTLTIHARNLNNENVDSKSRDIELFFEIMDTGVGIAEDAERVFSKFEQTQSGLSASSDTGLGIPLAKEHVQLMGGDMELQSQVNKGTNFRFSIQVTEEKSTWLDEGEPTHSILSLQPDKMNKYRILIADDIEANCQLLSKLLGSIGFLARTVQNGREAIETFHSWQPHLILMDLKIPEIDGLEVTREIKATSVGKETSIIVIGDSVFTKTRLKVFDAGANGFIIKPFKEHNLFKTIEDQLKVKYVYENEESLLHKIHLPELTSEIRNNVPEKLIVKMRKCVEIGNMSHFNELLEILDKKYNNVTYELRSLASNYDYKKILDILPGVVTNKQDDNLEESLCSRQDMQSMEDKTYRILIVEDDDGNRILAVNVLTSEGYLVKSTESGQKAIDIFSKWKPHLIIVDARLPIMNGFEVVKTIRSTPAGKETSIIMVSGNIHEETRYMAFEIGVNKYMVKPYDPDDLLKCVREQLKTI